jgi:hypothetical protein
MFTQAQIEYIQKQYARGLNADAISNKLIEAGWEKDDIKDGLEEVARLALLSSPVPNTVAPAIPNDTIVSPVSEISNTAPVESAGDATQGSGIIQNDVKVTDTPETKEPMVPVVEVKNVGMSTPPLANPAHPSHILKTVIFIALALLVLGGGAFSYYQFFYKPSLTNKIELINTATSSEEAIDLNATSTLEATSSEELLNTQEEQVLPDQSLENNIDTNTSAGPRVDENGFEISEENIAPQQ